MRIAGGATGAIDPVSAKRRSRPAASAPNPANIGKITAIAAMARTDSVSDGHAMSPRAARTRAGRSTEVATIVLTEGDIAEGIFALRRVSAHPRWRAVRHALPRNGCCKPSCKLSCKPGREASYKSGLQSDLCARTPPRLCVRARHFLRMYKKATTRRDCNH